MAGWEAHFPTEAGPTASFVPTAQQSADGSSIEKDRGIISERSADGSRWYSDRIHDAFNVYRYAFPDLPFAEYLLFEGFEATVGGSTFRFREDDVDCGIVLVFRTVKFAPGYRPKFQPTGGGKGSLTVELVDA